MIRVPSSFIPRKIQANTTQDMVLILFGTCISRMPSVQRMFGGRGRGGYHRVGDREPGTGGRNGGRDAEAENRLIDSYDEEWEN